MKTLEEIGRLQQFSEEYNLYLVNRKLELDSTRFPKISEILEFDKKLLAAIENAQKILLDRYNKFKFSGIFNEPGFKVMSGSLYLCPIDNQELEPLMNESGYLEYPLLVFTYHRGNLGPDLNYTEHDPYYSYEFIKEYQGLDLSLGLLYLTETNNIPLCDIVKFKEFDVKSRIEYIDLL